jgi:gluconolactonase
MSEPRILLADGLAFPEGPVFAPDGSLWWVEIEGSRIGRLAAGRIERFAIGGRPNGATFDAEGRLWIADQLLGIRRHDPATGATETVLDRLDGAPLGKPNDLAFDAAGNLIFTCSNDARTEPVGYVCVLRPNGEVAVIAGRLLFPNGLAFSDGGRRLWIAETFAHRVLCGAWDPATARWTADLAHEVGGPIGPDGMAFDDRGRLHVTIFGEGRVRIVDPAVGPIGEIAVPDRRPTNLAFDPSGPLGLVVSEVERGALWSFPDRRGAAPLFDGTVRR